jgi:hypothetical protein
MVGCAGRGVILSFLHLFLFLIFIKIYYIIYIQSERKEMINMTNKEMIVNVFSTYGAMTSRQAAVQVNNKHGVVLTPSQVAGALRPLIAKGYAANSKDSHNKTVYWLTDFGKEAIKNV